MNNNLVLDYFQVKLGAYQAPESEAAAHKGIPIELRDNPWVIRFIRENKYRVRYRGRRRPGVLGQQTCLRQDATSFALYPMS